MTTTQAMVESLTAEVRVLMVGNRQITQSVVKQLDRTPIGSLEPMGRINLPTESHLVIGRHIPDGTLRVSSYHELPTDSSRLLPYIFRDDLEGDIHVVEGYPSFKIDGRRFQVEKEAWVECTCSGPVASGSWHYSNLDEIRRLIQAEIQLYEDNIALRKQCEALPLIVLAGLR